MKLQELNSAWNRLRNAALGRGVTPLVPAELADRVGKRFEAWREWYDIESGPFADAIPSVAADEWIAEYRTLAAEVKAAGVDPGPALPETPFEGFKVASITIGKVAAVALGGLGALAILVIAWKSGSNGR